jgi:hypothetical protein
LHAQRIDATICSLERCTAGHQTLHAFNFTPCTTCRCIGSNVQHHCRHNSIMSDTYTVPVSVQCHPDVAVLFGERRCNKLIGDVLTNPTFTHELIQRAVSLSHS